MISCIQCGHDLQPNRVQFDGEVRGEPYTVEMKGLKCTHCGYQTIEGDAMPEFKRLLSDKYRVQHGLLTSQQIRDSRTLLGMTQKKFAALLGVGLASVKRWEMGRIQDQRSNERILQRTARQAEATDPYPSGLGLLHAIKKSLIAGAQTQGSTAFPAHMIGPGTTGQVFAAYGKVFFGTQRSNREMMGFYALIPNEGGKYDQGLPLKPPQCLTFQQHIED